MYENGIKFRGAYIICTHSNFVLQNEKIIKLQSVSLRKSALCLNVYGNISIHPSFIMLNCDISFQNKTLVFKQTREMKCHIISF